MTLSCDPSCVINVAAVSPISSDLFFKSEETGTRKFSSTQRGLYTIPYMARRCWLWSSAQEHKEYQAVNRKLIRPSLSDVQDQMSGRIQRKKPAPPDQTNAENFYYLKQMQSRTPMIVVLDKGETVHGVIEWYDKQCIKVHRANEPNLLIMKSCIRYMYKEQDASSNGNGSRAHHLEVE